MAMTDLDAPRGADAPAGTGRARSRAQHYRVMVVMLLPVFFVMLLGGSIMALGDNADFTLLFLALAVPVFLAAEFFMETAKPRILSRPWIASLRWFHDGLEALLHLLPVGILIPLALADYSKDGSTVVNFLTNTWGLVFGIAFVMGASGIVRSR